MPQTCRSPVLLQSRADEIAARDALHRHDLALLHDHAAAAQLVVRADLVREALEVGLEQMVLELREAAEPEVRDLREDRALVRDARREHDVERGDAIGGDEEVAVAEVVDVADFAAAGEREGEVGLR